MASLTITSGPRSGANFRIEGPVIVGRAADVEVRLDDTTVSRRHAQLRRGPAGWTLTDLGTQNGTLVNGQRLTQPAVLHDGDRVQFGTVAASFQESELKTSAEQPAVSFVDKDSSKAVVVTLDAAGAGVPLSAGEAAKSKSLAQRLEFLSDLAGSLGATFDESALLHLILDRLFDLLPQADRGFVLLLDEKGKDGDLEPRAVRRRSEDASRFSVSRTLVRDVIDKRQAVLTMDAKEDSRFNRSESLVGLALHSVVCVPILTGSEVYGVIQIDSSRAGQPFDEKDMALLLGIARQLALAIANARLHTQLMEQELMQRDLELAGKLQQRFLPKRLPEISGYSFSVEYSPALEVGGDFYAFLELASGAIGIAVGDVSGKGVSAALAMARLTSELRYHAVGESEPAVILARVNRSFCEDLEEGMFVTVALLALDPAN